MNLFAISCLIVIFPVLAQVVLGSMIILKRIKWRFDLVCVINIIAEVLAIYVALNIVSFYAYKQNVRCGMPQTAMFFFGVVCAMVLVFVVGIQIGIRQLKKHKEIE